MAMSVIGAVLSAILPTVLDRIPDPVERAKAREDALRSAMEYERAVTDKQSEINAIEAQSESLFKYGPRPAALWVCVSTLAYSGFHPLLVWFSEIVGIASPPVLDSTGSTTLLVSLLGLGAYRTVEKVTGSATIPQVKPIRAPTRLVQ